MKRSQIIDRQGKQFVLYSGLLGEAHDNGLISLTTEHIVITADLAVFKATAVVDDEGVTRTFTSYGDATPANVGGNIKPHFIRMAETRAKARALRDALNIGDVSLEELIDEGEAPPPGAPPAQAARPNPAPANGRSAAAPQAAPAANGKPAGPTPAALAENLKKMRREAEVLNAALGLGEHGILIPLVDFPAKQEQGPLVQALKSQQGRTVFALEQYAKKMGVPDVPASPALEAPAAEWSGHRKALVILCADHAGKLEAVQAQLGG